jgi:hypothetical protein
MKENNHQVRTKGHHPRGLGAATPMYFYFEESPEMGKKLWTKLTVFQSLKKAYSRQEVAKKSTIVIWISSVTFLLGADSQVCRQRFAWPQCLLRASQHHVWVFPLLPESQQKLRTQIVYNGLPKFLGRLLYAYLHPLLGADELSG